MAVNHVGEVYVCDICGNEVEVTVVGGGTLVCCGKDMTVVGE
jgi:desulfoferrodoxin-like iron-binding protein